MLRVPDRSAARVVVGDPGGEVRRGAEAVGVLIARGADRVERRDPGGEVGRRQHAVAVGVGDAGFFAHHNNPVRGRRSKGDHRAVGTRAGVGRRVTVSTCPITASVPVSMIVSSPSRSR